MYGAGEVSLHRACYEHATQPHSLGGGGTICPGSRPALPNRFYSMQLHNKHKHFILKATLNA